MTVAVDTSIPYWYTGHCPQTGVLLRLPRTLEIEAIARQLMQALATDPTYDQEGKMYGVLLVTRPDGQRQVLQAFSGLLHQQAHLEGWVPPIPGREQVALAEAQVLAQLNQIRDQLRACTQQFQAIQKDYAERSQGFAVQWQALTQAHAERKQARAQQRQCLLDTDQGQTTEQAIAALDAESRQDGLERRWFKRDRDAILLPLQQEQTDLLTRIQALKQQRKQLSRQLQTQMHQSYWLRNFAGESLPLHRIYGAQMPTGTGDCCAPKLLHFAASQHLKPLAMAEFWWGPSSPKGDRVAGQFYEACAERCQPIMGFLLSGLPRFPVSDISSDTPDLPILYEDDWLIAIDKPAGWLSVPGRSDRRECVISHLQAQLNSSVELRAVHRLDQDTSGVLLMAKDPETHRYLSLQFQNRRVQKEYQALLAQPIQPESGVIDLPLWGDPCDRPRQSVNWQKGKPSLTYFWRLSQVGDRPRLAFQPITGRTHQLRVHAADLQGLGTPILGDRLYGQGSATQRLHLHAKGITLLHPHTQTTLHLEAPVPF